MDLHSIPRLGLITAPSLISPLPALPGTKWVGVKRDDCIPALYGGSKPRKLDYLLADPAFASAKRWVSGGAIGSGHLVAVTAAARQLGRHLIAHCFNEPLTSHVTENLAYIASHATVRYYPDRLRLALSAPAVVRGGETIDGVVIPFGATSPSGMMGMVQAGLELSAQVQAGELPAPDRIYIAFGSGGNVAGLSLGLAMGRLRTTLHAVAVVEWPLNDRLRLRRLQQDLRGWLAQRGISTPTPVAVHIDRTQVGPGYGVPTPAAWRGVEALQASGLGAEPVYTGRAMAALLSAKDLPPNVLYWHTLRQPHLPHTPNWESRLPPALRARLSAGDAPSRRWVLGAGLGLAALALGARRIGDYPAWEGQVLAPWEAEVLRAVIEAGVPEASPRLRAAAPAITDRFLRDLSPQARLEIHGLFLLMEQCVPDLDRLSRLTPAERLEFIEGMASLGRLPAVAARGLWELALLGVYADPELWPTLGYGGPLVPEQRVPDTYADLRAPAGALPRSAG